jgi:signal transduction histidine kinase
MRLPMKDLWLRRPGAGLFLFISYCIWAAVSLRWITEFIEQQHPLTWAISAILLLYGLLLGIEPLLTGDSQLRAHLYLAFQTGLVFIASLFYFELDFFALLYMPLCGQAMFLLPRRQGLAWLGILIVVTAVGQTIQFGMPQALSFILLYTAALIFVAFFASMVQQANAARERSEDLLAQLQSAHDQLQIFTNQAEELAIANERTRLARDLHDSVAQTLYGLTLQAEAASRKLSAGQTAAVQDHLRRIGEDAQQTLQETRLLIFELRPPILQNSGLAAALKARLDAVEARGGVTMRLDLQEVHDLPEAVETGLYRIAQEALNNAARHAGASELDVRLAQNGDWVTLEIEDNGRGFDPAAVPAGSLGLQGISERVQQMDGRLTVESAPGSGTTIKVEVPL